MKMNPLQWKSKRFLTVVLVLVVLYLFFRVRQYQYDAAVLLPHVKPTEPWEYIADFSNMKYLNPTITDFTITKESGNYDHWKYSVEYSEELSHWPYLANQAVAHFQVKANHPKELYFIHSNHQTCLFSGWYCLNSFSEFKFSKSNLTKGTLCEETVLYECPVFLSSFCQREVVFQRNAIMNNLRNKFNKT